MYKYTRPEVAEKLNISTRSVDRYIKSWKLRSKKEWKIVYIKASDVDNLLSWPFTKHEVIVPKKLKEEKTVAITTNDEGRVQGTLDYIYKDLRDNIQKKDDLIQWLSEKLWRHEEIVKNSISLTEYKKSQFLLDESKTYLSKEVDDLKWERNKLEKEFKKERNYNILLVLLVVMLLAITVTIWIKWI